MCLLSCVSVLCAYIIHNEGDSIYIAYMYHVTDYDAIFHDYPSSSAVVLGCLVASIILDTNEGPAVNDQYWVNTMRDAFTCNPRFSGSPRSTFMK